MKKNLQIIEDAWKHRRDYVSKEKLQAFRLVNGEADAFPGLEIDYYDGDFLIRPDKKYELQSLGDLEKSLTLWRRGNFPNAQGECFWVGRDNANPGHLKMISEDGLFYEVKLGEGKHTGIFLDQRENRRFLRSQVRGKKVLNLFCHTGAFTMAAFAGGAKHVDSVDLSKPYLDWLERNLHLNEFNSSRARGHVGDVFLFLEKLKRRSKKFDVIVIDPPTFSRGKKGVFSTRQHFSNLIELAAAVLAPHGAMLLSLNTENISLKDFLQQVKWTLQPWNLEILKMLSLPLDFRLTDLQRKNPYLKACWVG